MIVFIDEEKRRMESFKDELELSLPDTEVHFFDDIDDGWHFFTGNYEIIQLMIIDLMMPWGNTFTKEETEDGRRTGIALLKKIRQVSLDIKIVILTHIKSETIESAIKTERNCWIFRKEHYLPFEFAKEIEKIMHTNR